jgi:hypothetical protein
MAHIDEPASADPDVPEPWPEAEETVVVDREAEAETLVVDRTLSRAEVEGTLAVTRQRSTGAAVNVPSTGRRRRGMSMPPVDPGYGRGAIDAVGPGAVTAYEPRTMPDLVTTAMEFGSVEATRGDSTALPSVERRARRTGLVALAIFAASCVVSVVGLVALGLAVFS